MVSPIMQMSLASNTSLLNVTDNVSSLDILSIRVEVSAPLQELRLNRMYNLKDCG
jgi:hypothetical protein